MTDELGPAWRIDISSEAGIRLRTNEPLHDLLSLQRIANALRFAMASALSHGKDLTPDATRQRLSAFLYTCGIVAEALLFLPRLNKHFKGKAAFEQYVRPLLDDKEVQLLRTTYLTPIRNKAVFHNDRVVMEQGLGRIWMKSYPIIGGSTLRAGDTYYNLADIVTIAYLIGGKPQSSQEFYEQLGGVIEATNNVALRIVSAADELTKEWLDQLDDSEKSVLALDSNGEPMTG